MPYKTFDRSRLMIKPISERIHDLHLPQMLVSIDDPVPDFSDPSIAKISAAIVEAKKKKSASHSDDGSTSVAKRNESPDH